MRVLALFAIYYASAGYALLNPVFGALFFVHIMIFRPENLAWENPIFGRLHLITAICTGVGYLMRRGAETPTFGSHKRLTAILFAAFGAWLWLVSAFSAVSVSESTDRALDITKIFFFCLMLGTVLVSPGRIRLYVLVSCGSFGLLSLWGVVQGMAGNWRLDNVWIAGSNYLAAVLALMIPFSLAAAMDREFSRWGRVGLAGCATMMALCLVYTDSRGGFLGLLGGLLSLVLFTKQRAKLLIGMLVIAIIAYPTIPAEYGKRVSGFVQQGDEEVDLSAESRPVLWRLALRVWEDNPMFGVGLGNFPLVVDSYAGQSQDIVKTQAMAELIIGRNRAPHGLYTGMLAEAGVVGLALFLVLLVRSLRTRFDSRHVGVALIGRGAQAGIFGFAVAAVFGDYQYIDVLYWQCFLISAIHASSEVCDEVRTDLGGSLTPSKLV